MFGEPYIYSGTFINSKYKRHEKIISTPLLEPIPAYNIIVDKLMKFTKKIQETFNEIIEVNKFSPLHQIIFCLQSTVHKPEFTEPKFTKSTDYKLRVSNIISVDAYMKVQFNLCHKLRFEPTLKNKRQHIKDKPKCIEPTENTLDPKDNLLIKVPIKRELKKKKPQVKKKKKPPSTMIEIHESIQEDNELPL